MQIAEGSTVRVVAIVPQNYADSNEIHQRAEVAHVGRFLDKLGEVLAVDAAGGRHPVLVRFSSNCSQCGGRIRPQEMRFGMQELSISRKEV